MTSVPIGVRHLFLLLFCSISVHLKYRKEKTAGVLMGKQPVNCEAVARDEIARRALKLLREIKSVTFATIKTGNRRLHHHE
jgi:hypothetical protein